MIPQPWSSWQQQVIAAIRINLRDVLDSVEEGDIDWDAWRPLFEAGRSPDAAVAQAFMRDPDEVPTQSG